MHGVTFELEHFPAGQHPGRRTGTRVQQDEIAALDAPLEFGVYGLYADLPHRSPKRVTVERALVGHGLGLEIAVLSKRYGFRRGHSRFLLTTATLPVSRGL